MAKGARVRPVEAPAEGPSPSNKKGKVEKGPVDVEALKPQWLRGASGGQLLGRLVQTSKALESVDPAPYSELPFSSAFFDEMCKPEYVASGSADVQVVTASIIADLLRILKGTLQLSQAPAKSILRLFLAVFNRLRTNKTAYLPTVRHVMEVVSSTHSMALLMQVSADVTEDEMLELTDTLLNHVPSDDDAMTSQMAQILADMVSIAKSVSEPQLAMIMAPLGSQSNPTGWRVAAAVLKRHEDLMQNVVHGHIMNLLESAVDQLRKFDVVDGNPTEKRAILKLISDACDMFVECCAASLSLVLHAVPAVAHYLQHEDPDVRLLVVRGLCKAFLRIPSMQQEYTQVFHSLLGRFSDQRVLVRAEMLRFAGDLLKANPLSDTLWAYFTRLITEKVTEQDESIRKSAISLVCELATAAPQRIPIKLVEAVGERCADRRLAVRQAAIEGLARLYANLYVVARGAFERYRWIPNKILLSVNVEGNGALVELALPIMLPASLPTEAASPSSKGKKKSSKAPVSVFDFEQTEDPVGAAPEDSAAATSASFGAILVDLCASLDAHAMNYLTVFMGKKLQMRKTVESLLLLRNQVKEIGPGTDEGKQVVSKIHRLLAFLQTATHARNDEWDTIFKLRDEKAVKSLLTLCSAMCVDHAKQAADFLSRIKACTKKDVASFVENELLPRLSLPITSEHVDDLVRQITSRRNSTTDASQQRARTDALRCIGLMAPRYLIPHAGTIFTWVKEDAESKEAESEGQMRCMEADLAVLALLRVDTQEVADEADQLPASLADRSKDVITTIGRITLQTLSGGTAKAAAKCLVSLFRNHTRAFQQLLQAIKEKLVAASKESAAAMPKQVVGWLHAFKVLAEHEPNAVAKYGDEVYDAITAILFAATRGSSAGDEVAEAKARKAGDSLKARRSQLCDVTDAAAKALVSYVSGLPAHIKQAKSTELLDSLISAFKSTRELGMSTVGACRKRLALDKQMAKMLLRSPITTQYLTVAIFISAEENLEVRQEVQQKLAHHLLEGRGDMQFSALLFLTAIAEESRSSFATLKAHVQDVGDRLRARQQTANVTLSENRALSCYLEYSIPAIVMCMAHHAFFNSERDNSFTAFQRVWHLLFDELLRSGTQCVSFVTEVLRKLKQHDDYFAPDTNSTRVICDLAAKVLNEVLAQKSVGLDTIKQFPGSVLLPQCFLKPEDPNKFPFEEVYLDSTTHITKQAMFKGPSMTPARGSRPGVSSSAPRDTEAASDADAEEEWGVEDAAVAGAVTPAPRPVTRDAPSTAAKARKASVSVRTAQASPAPNLQTRVSQAVEELCKGISYEQLRAMTWRTVRNKVEEFGVPVDDTTTPLVKEALRNALDVAAAAAGSPQ